MANHLLAHSEAERKVLRKSLDAERVHRTSESTAPASSKSACSSRSSTSSEGSTDNPSGRSVSSCTTGEEEHLHAEVASPRVIRQALKKLQERRRDKLQQLQRRSRASYRRPPSLVNRRSVAEPEPDPPDIDLSTVEGAAMPGLPKASSKGLAKATWNVTHNEDCAAASALQGLDVILAGIRAPWFTSTAEHSGQPQQVVNWHRWQQVTPRLPENQGGCSVLDWACCRPACGTTDIPEGRAVTRKLNIDSRSCGMFGW